MKNLQPHWEGGWGAGIRGQCGARGKAVAILGYAPTLKMAAAILGRGPAAAERQSWKAGPTFEHVFARFNQRGRRKNPLAARDQLQHLRRVHRSAEVCVGVGVCVCVCVCVRVCVCHRVKIEKK